MNYPMIAKIIIVITAIGVGYSTTRIFHMKNDNAIEQAAEGIIKENTGVVVDFSTEETK